MPDTIGLAEAADRLGREVEDVEAAILAGRLQMTRDHLGQPLVVLPLPRSIPPVEHPRSAGVDDGLISRDALRVISWASIPIAALIAITVGGRSVILIKLVILVPIILGGWAYQRRRRRS